MSILRLLALEIKRKSVVLSQEEERIFTAFATNGFKKPPSTTNTQIPAYFSVHKKATKTYTEEKSREKRTWQSDIQQVSPRRRLACVSIKIKQDCSQNRKQYAPGVVGSFIRLFLNHATEITNCGARGPVLKGQTPQPPTWSFVLLLFVIGIVNVTKLFSY